jgi:hypothetical protein
MGLDVQIRYFVAKTEEILGGSWFRKIYFGALQTLFLVFQLIYRSIREMQIAYSLTIMAVEISSRKTVGRPGG